MIAYSGFRIRSAPLQRLSARTSNRIARRSKVLLRGGECTLSYGFARGGRRRAKVGMPSMVSILLQFRRREHPSGGLRQQLLVQRKQATDDSTWDQERRTWSRQLGVFRARP